MNYKYILKGAPDMMENKFNNSIGGLIGVKIGFYLHGNQYMEGTLLAVKHDHIIVNVNQRVIYFALEQIQAFSKNAKNFQISSEDIQYVDKKQLTDVLNDLTYSWITINCISNQAFSGILSRVYEDDIILINNTEQFFVQKSYITNVFNGVLNKPEEENVEQSKSTQDDSSSSTESESSSNSKSTSFFYTRI